MNATGEFRLANWPSMVFRVHPQSTSLCESPMEVYLQVKEEGGWADFIRCFKKEVIAQLRQAPAGHQNVGGFQKGRSCPTRQ